MGTSDQYSISRLMCIRSDDVTAANSRGGSPWCGPEVGFDEIIRLISRKPVLDRLRLGDDAGFKPRPFGDQFYRHPSITKFDLGLDSEHARLLSMLRPFCSAACSCGCLSPFCRVCAAGALQAYGCSRLDIVPLTSRIFHNTRNLRVWLPPGYDPSQKYPVLYILDGASAFDVCASFKPRRDACR